MTQTANNYGTVLFELGVKKETVEETKRNFFTDRRIARTCWRVRSYPTDAKHQSHRRQFFRKR